MMTAFLSAMVLFGATPSFETFGAPGFKHPVSGVRYRATDTVSPIPLGGLGTGFIEMTPDGRFGGMTTRNTWLKPEPVDEKSAILIGVNGDTPRPITELMAQDASQRTFWGHFPAADYDLGDIGSVSVHIRAFAPLVPHEYSLSGLPVVYFRVRTQNKTSTPVPVTVGLRWRVAEAETVADDKAAELRLPKGNYAFGSSGKGWAATTQTASDNSIEALARRELAPGETSIVTLGLAWHFPSWDSSDGEALRHHYATAYSDSRAVLADALERADEAEDALVSWQSTVFGANAPAELQDALLNSLYVLARNSWWLDDGRFLQSESFTGCPITETFVCRFNGSFPLALMWPELEKATMREMTRHQAENGQIPFGLGSPAGSRTPMMNLQVPIVSTEFALVAWRNFSLWHDKTYLAEVYPAVKRALKFAMTLDTDGDGLVNEAPGSEEGFPANQYYDIWPWWGTSAYTGSISLAAWRAGEEMAKKQSDYEFAAEMRNWSERGARAFREKLWTGHHYRLYSGDAKHSPSESSLTNALCGQWFASATGLGDIVPRNTIDATIDTVLALNAKATEYGAVNGVHPDGSPDETFKDHSAVITIGEVWNFCAMAAHAGQRDAALDLFARSYRNIALRQKTPWNIPWSLDRDTGAIKWGIHYYSNPCVWTILQAVDESTYRQLGQSRRIG